MCSFVESLESKQKYPVLINWKLSSLSYFSNSGSTYASLITVSEFGFTLILPSSLYTPFLHLQYFHTDEFCFFRSWYRYPVDRSADLSSIRLVSSSGFWIICRIYTGYIAVLIYIISCTCHKICIIRRTSLPTYNDGIS